ncbi:AraC family transcriptional regulator [Marinobacterium lutimaris]|uniref:Transcriptional regulator, AraC family n=1 Tax=Marinobacterium lutimaris TaxID=568106 RepID=A0A1H6AJY5_9GAMM|nr:AraC family transcriptional regulator [Marinobacterium lutimaris]SEG48474.1 transcriptional regulator, AraC family [Marinobacterium lutimaris]
MSSALRVFHGDFGRVALLDMNKPLVTHAHSECHVLIKVSGEDTFFHVRDRKVALTDTTAVLVNAWEPHYYDYQPGAGNTQILALYIEPQWLATAQQSLLLSGHPDFFSHPCIDLNRRNRTLADHLIAEMCGFGLAQEDKVEFHLLDLLISLIEDFSELKHLSRLGVSLPREGFDARIRRANQYMLERLDDPDVIVKAATACGLSRAHFFALYKKQVGMTPSVYLNTERMNKALHWLAHKRSGTLGVLSEELGFSEQCHFTRFFQRHIGAPPSQYQRVLDVNRG